MKMWKYLLAYAVIGSTISPHVAFAQTYPSKPVELIVTYPPGGGTDVLARAFADAARPYFAQPFVVLNKPGATGSIGLSYVANAPADGYKAVIISTDLMTLPYMSVAKVGPDDFIPVARFQSDPTSLTVRADSPWKTIEDFVAYAKANPGKATISDAGRGGTIHLAAAFLADKAGITVNHIPYQGSAPAIMALLGGQVDATTIAYGELKSHVETGKLRTIGVLSDKRIPGLDAPTFKERGIDASMIVWRGIGVAKGTPPEIVNKLAEVVEKVVATPAFRETLSKQNLTMSYAGPREIKAFMAAQNDEFKRELPKWKIKTE